MTVDIVIENTSIVGAPPPNQRLPHTITPPNQSIPHPLEGQPLDPSQISNKTPGDTFLRFRKE